MFHGGFGLIANGLIPKPTMWTFAYFNRLKGEPVYRDERMVMVRNKDGSYEGVAWNLCRENQEDMRISIGLPGGGAYTLLTGTVDEESCNPLKVWHEMGEPSSLSKDELEFLKTAAQPRNRSALIQAGGEAELILGRNAVVHFTLRPYRPVSEYGYDYEWYRKHY